MINLLNKLRNKDGSGYLDMMVLILVSMIVIALAVNIYPVFIIKDQLNELAKQTLRESQLEGKVYINYSSIADSVGVVPDSIEWEANTIGMNKVQFGEEIIVTFNKMVDIGFFEFGSFPIYLKAKAIGKSEVYWK